MKYLSIYCTFATLHILTMEQASQELDNLPKITLREINHGVSYALCNNDRALAKHWAQRATQFANSQWSALNDTQKNKFKKDYECMLRSIKHVEEKGPRKKNKKKVPFQEQMLSSPKIIKKKERYNK